MSFDREQEFRQVGERECSVFEIEERRRESYFMDDYFKKINYYKKIEVSKGLTVGYGLKSESDEDEEEMVNEIMLQKQIRDELLERDIERNEKELDAIEKKKRQEEEKRIKEKDELRKSHEIIISNAQAYYSCCICKCSQSTTEISLFESSYGKFIPMCSPCYSEVIRKKTVNPNIEFKDLFETERKMDIGETFRIKCEKCQRNTHVCLSKITNEGNKFAFLCFSCAKEGIDSQVKTFLIVNCICNQKEGKTINPENPVFLKKVDKSLFVQRCIDCINKKEDQNWRTNTKKELKFGPHWRTKKNDKKQTQTPLVTKNRFEIPKQK